MRGHPRETTTHKARDRCHDSRSATRQLTDGHVLRGPHQLPAQAAGHLARMALGATATQRPVRKRAAPISTSTELATVRPLPHR